MPQITHIVTHYHLESWRVNSMSTATSLEEMELIAIELMNKGKIVSKIYKVDSPLDMFELGLSIGLNNDGFCGGQREEIKEILNEKSTST